MAITTPQMTSCEQPKEHYDWQTIEEAVFSNGNKGGQVDGVAPLKHMKCND